MVSFPSVNARGNFRVKLSRVEHVRGNVRGMSGEKCPDPMQDYKSLRVVVVMICAALVNRQTDRQFLAGYTIISAS